MEQPVGEDMAALGVGGELNFVDGDEVGLQLARHRFHGADIEAGTRRLDLLFARNQRNLARAHLGDHLLVDLAREEPQGQADHADIVGEHALDGEMGLARVGRAQHGGNAPPAIGRSVRANRLRACGLCG